jgi:hypothetical protein
MATKEQNGPSEVKEFLPMCSNALGAFERRSSQPAFHVVALSGPIIPSLPAMRRGGYLCSKVECTFETHASVRSNVWPAFEHRPVTCQHTSSI